MKRFTRRIMIRANEDHHKHQEEDNKEEGRGGGGHEEDKVPLRSSMGNMGSLKGTWET
jgi:hypothetical protein